MSKIKQRKIKLKGRIQLAPYSIKNENKLCTFYLICCYKNVHKVACNNTLRDIVWRTNYVITKCGSCTADIRSFMFRTYCTSFYRSPLWRLSSPDLNGIYVTWKKCVRRIWHVSPRTYYRLLRHLVEGQW